MTAVALVVLLAVQAAVVPRIGIHIGGGVAEPDLLLILVVHLALVLPPIDACVASWLVGLCADLRFVRPLGLLAFVYLLVTLGIVRFRSEMFAAHFLTRLLMVAGAGLVRAVAVMVVETVRNRSFDVFTFWAPALSGVLYTVAAAVVLLPLLSLVLRPLRVLRARG